jgi:riboflavin kinase/FMN adenylyltransferase
VGGTEARLEVYLFGCDQNLYGQRLESDLISFLRPEQKFAGLEALQAQIARDAVSARTVLGGA